MIDPTNGTSAEVPLPDASAIPAPVQIPAPRPSEEGSQADPRPVHPSEKEMGLVPLVLDKGIRTTAIGVLYGLDFDISAKGFSARVFFDHYNRRLKVLDYQAEQYGALVERLAWLSEQNGFDKIFLKARRGDWQKFLSLGFVLEGILKYYFRGEDAYVMSRFSSIARATSVHVIDEGRIIETVMRRPTSPTPPVLPDGYTQMLCTEEDIPTLVRLYRRVFKSYPSPLTHPDYLQQTMRRNMIYRAALGPDGKMASAASVEIDTKHSTAEMSDCATLQAHRGKGLMLYLLHVLEGDLRERGIMSGHSYARAKSRGMNQVFYHLGYEYTGRLINSCDIQGQMEDMNLWTKALSPIASEQT